MALTSAREKRLWLQAALVQIAIYASLAYVRGISTWLRERNLLRLTIGLLFLIAVVLILDGIRRRRPGIGQILVLAAFGVIYLVVLWDLKQVEERVHFLEYGLVGGLIYSALWERRTNLVEAGTGPRGLARLPAVSTIVITGLLGWGDEGIQAILPERFYELRDVAMNFAAGVLVVAAMVSMRRARAWDSRRAGRLKGERPGSMTDP